ncbi:hypothetical protein TPL01_11560 [Sulfuriferula plumbiphila]|uniref:Uncharacterized protein n=1 Tax=Sulfuriferula plumbiphila TaxID=171865 RepID=A0A512L6A7_9PROT|nr:hypothetical protein SFPGR_10390 [Sulfuriferula plumbiphila]GEP30018.1 hypothetical protein TPL01_11560 [Sulfuriferula plumbiphila]
MATQYRSPTVGLYFNPADYLSFISDLQKLLDADLELDKSGSEQTGELYSQWHRLNGALFLTMLKGLAA